MGLERTIVERVKTQLRNIDGGASYTYDVSGDDQVVIGQTFSSHRIPGVYLFVNGTTTKQDAGRTVLTRYDRQMKVQIEAWVPSTSASAGTALLDALDMQDDIFRAIESDRSLGGNVRDVELEATTYEGAEMDRPGLGMVVCILTIRYTETAGA